MQEFIIEIVKSDEIYRKIANASLEKKDDIYRYDFANCWKAMALL